MMVDQQVNTRGSEAVHAIELAWTELQKAILALPDVVITLVDASSRSSRNGYFAPVRWEKDGTQKMHEIGVSPDLIQTPEEMLATIIHEAAHALLMDVGENGGMSHRTCGYHMTTFRDKAIELGLTCGWYNSRHGWNQTSWAQQIPEKYRDALEALKTNLPSGTTFKRRQIRTEKPLPEKGHVVMACRCTPPVKIHIGRRCAEHVKICCQHCNKNFEAFSPK